MNIEEVAAELKAANMKGVNVVELATRCKEMLGSGFGVISFIASFNLAFGVPLQVLQQAQAWEGFGWGDLTISDSDFRDMLNPWIIEQRSSS